MLLVQELTLPTGSTDRPIDVGTAKEARGLTTSIGYLVSVSFVDLLQTRQPND